jgi:rhodanese-related sulfurtransferase
LSGEITAEELKQRLKQGERLNLVDVREDDEWEEGHIPEARHVALSRLQDSLGDLNDSDGPLLLICRSGGRSGKACAYLDSLGYDVVNVQGGMLAWSGSVVQGR